MWAQGRELGRVSVSRVGREKTDKLMMVDTGASMQLLTHLPEHRRQMYNLRPVRAGDRVMMNKHPEPVEAIGSLDLWVRCEATGKIVMMHFDEVLYVPGSGYVLFGWSAYAESFSRTGPEPKLLTGRETVSVPVQGGGMVVGKKQQGLYFLRLVAQPGRIARAQPAVKVEEERVAEESVNKDNLTMGHESWRRPTKS